MAKEISQVVESRKILADIRKGAFAPVYLLMGDEPYYIDQITDALVKHVVPEDDRDFNLVTLYGKDTDVVSVIAACQQYPFMSDRKLVMLKEAQTLQQAKVQLEELADYVAHPTDGNVLVVAFKGDSLNGNGRLMKMAAKAGAVIFKSQRLYDYQLDEVIRSYCTANRLGIDDKAMEMLKEYLGTSLSKLFGEIEKLRVAEGKGMARITPEMIEKNIGMSKDYNNYELCHSLAVRDYDRCMRIVKYFASNPKQNPVVVTVGTLFSFFQKLFIGNMTKDKSEKNLMAVMELNKPVIFRKDYMPG
ncbi:MAG: DNA polymerase III subunit delta, partial [Muribaculaceae bacterium]|nr:DNA polymerase III subunit delta [Muribaculaceae bacterium]